MKAYILRRDEASLNQCANLLESVGNETFAMNILLTGGTGFIGQSLVPRLLDEGHDVSIYTRRPKWAQQQWQAISAIRSWKQLKQCPDAVINLAGEGIANARWSERRKRELWDSRITLTQDMARYFEQQSWVPSVVLSGSAVGYYGHTGDEWVNEENTAGADFGAQLCQSWEMCLKPLEEAGSRLCWLRTGVVLGHGGLLERLRLPFRACLGGRLGSGLQFMSWIHIQDWVNICMHLLNTQGAKGPFNLCAPNPVTNRDFTSALARQLNRPAWCHQPKGLLKLVLGEMSELLIYGQRASSKHVEELGYAFDFPTLQSALTDIFESKKASFSSDRTN